MKRKKSDTKGVRERERERKRMDGWVSVKQNRQQQTPTDAGPLSVLCEGESNCTVQLWMKKRSEKERERERERTVNL